MCEVVGRAFFNELTTVCGGGLIWHLVFDEVWVGTQGLCCVTAAAGQQGGRGGEGG